MISSVLGRKSQKSGKMNEVPPLEGLGMGGPAQRAACVKVPRGVILDRVGNQGEIPMTD